MTEELLYSGKIAAVLIKVSAGAVPKSMCGDSLVFPTELYAVVRNDYT